MVVGADISGRPDRRKGVIVGSEIGGASMPGDGSDVRRKLRLACLARAVEAMAGTQCADGNERRSCALKAAQDFEGWVSGPAARSVITPEMHGSWIYINASGLPVARTSAEPPESVAGEPVATGDGFVSLPSQGAYPAAQKQARDTVSAVIQGAAYRTILLGHPSAAQIAANILAEFETESGLAILDRFVKTAVRG